MNTTINLKLEGYENYKPTQQAFDWCKEQIAHYEATLKLENMNILFVLTISLFIQYFLYRHTLAISNFFELKEEFIMLVAKSMNLGNIFLLLAFLFLNV